MGKYLDKIRQHEHVEPVSPIETRQAASVSPIPPGSHITWTRGDGTVQVGVVDYLHVDDTGTPWAFVTLGKAWSAVNTKFVKVVKA